MKQSGGRGGKRGADSDDGDSLDGSESDVESTVSSPDSDDDSMSESSASSGRPKKKQKKAPAPKKAPAKAQSKTATSSTKTSAKEPPSKAVSTAASSSAPPTPSTMPTPIVTIGGIDITQGPPVSTDSAAKKLLLQYFRQQNRPYSALQVFDNLHKRIPKATLERVLGVLSGPGEGLLSKEYGKARIYYPDQSTIASDHTAAQLEQMAEDNEDLRKTVADGLAKEKELRAKLSALLAEPPDDELDRRIAEAEERVAAKEQRLQALTSNSTAASPNALKNAIRQHNNARAQWAARRSMCMDALDMIAESMDKKRSVLVSELGIETDEDAKAILPPIVKEPPASAAAKR